jgi:hypothetical protein
MARKEPEDRPAKGRGMQRPGAEQARRRPEREMEAAAEMGLELPGVPAAGPGAAGAEREPRNRRDRR